MLIFNPNKTVRFNPFFVQVILFIFLNTYTNAQIVHDFNMPFSSINDVEKPEQTIYQPVYKSGAINSPKRELRGAWIATVSNIDYPSSPSLSVATQKSQFIALLDALKSSGINAVFVQIRASCDAFYNSPYEPWSEWLTGQQGLAPQAGYDPLVFMTDEAHKRGIEFHAWVNPYRAVVNINSSSIASNHISVKQPSWCVTYNSLKILNPGLPQVREYVTKIVADIVTRYPVDGVHFDDYFYPYPSGGTVFNDNATFTTYPQGFTNKDDWRRNNVNMLVKMVHDTIKKIKPYVKFGIGPFGIWKNGVPSGIVGLSSYSEIYCDPIAWLNNQSIDYVAPQLYWKIGGNQDFDKLTTWWGDEASAKNRHCYAGCASYRLAPGSGDWSASEMLNQINVSRQKNTKVQGDVFFSASSIDDNLKSFSDSLKQTHNKYMCLIPTMPWLDAVSPEAPINSGYTLLSNGVKLTWQKPAKASDGDTAKYFVIYRNINGTVDINDPKQIIHISAEPITSYTDIINLSGKTVNYAVTACDKLHNESTPVIIQPNNSSVDIIPPVTSANLPSNWITSSLSVQFSDTDNSGGSGVEKSFLLISDYDGTQWRSNGNYGYFNDEFNTSSIHSDWTNVTSQAGSWQTTTGYLNQSDETVTNPNLYAQVNQTSSHTYLYSWKMNLSGPGTNQRAGMYIFCSDPTMSHRNNSYLIYWRYNPGQVEIYKSTNNSISGVLHSVAVPISLNSWFDAKVTYNPNSGQFKVFYNDKLITSWTDTSPLKSGNAISLRSGNTNVYYDDIQVFKSRGSSETISAGVSQELRYQNSNPNTPAGRINSLAYDVAGNASSISSKYVNVDWTIPLSGTVSDGASVDTDTCYLVSELTSNWTASSDPHSGVKSYWYAIGTTSGATDVVSWTNNGTSTFVTHTGLALSYGVTYYFSIKTENGAGLFSAPVSSDGQKLIQTQGAPLANFLISNNTICEGEEVTFLNTSSNAISFSWSFPGGTPSISNASSPSILFKNSGTYSATLEVAGTGGTSNKKTELFSITVIPKPKAAFSVQNTVVAKSSAVSFLNTSQYADSYFWDFGDGSLSSLENPVHVYNDTGIYSVSLIAFSNDCLNDTLAMNQYILVNENGVGINDDVLINSLSVVYPNPATRQITIEIPALLLYNSLTVRLVDALGRNIKTEESIHKKTISFDISAIEPGWYFVEITDRKGNFQIIKFIK